MEQTVFKCRLEIALSSQRNAIARRRSLRKSADNKLDIIVTFYQRENRCASIDIELPDRNDEIPSVKLHLSPACCPGVCFKAPPNRCQSSFYEEQDL